VSVAMQSVTQTYSGNKVN